MQRKWQQQTRTSIIDTHEVSLCRPAAAWAILRPEKDPEVRGVWVHGVHADELFWEHATRSLAIARSSAEGAVLDRKHWGDQPRRPIICFDSPVTEIFINNPGFMNWSATVCGSSVILEFFEQTLMPWVWTCVSYTLRVLLKRPCELLSYSLCPWDISKA